MSACRRADICTCVGHSDLMTPLFPSPLVSEWLIQGQTQSQTITLACNDSAMLLEEVKRKVREDGRRWIMWGGELKAQNNIREAVGTLQNFSLWLTLVWLALSSLPLSSCFDISSCGTLEKGEDTIQRIKLSANTDGRGCTAISQQRGSLRPLSPFGNNQGWFFFFFFFWLNYPVGASEWRGVDDLMHMVRISWNIWTYFIMIIIISSSVVTEFLQ